ncbi:MAG: phospholipase D-like domain-containing protein [Nocardioides sp.]
MTTLLTVTQLSRATRRSVVVALAAGLALAVLMSTAPTSTLLQTRPAATRVGTYTPTTGAIFNRPIGSNAEKRAIFRHVNKTIEAAPAGSTIRFAVYSFAEARTADRLVAAHQRGVRVQVIFNDHKIYGPERRLQKVLGSNPRARSFARSCEGSCRDGKGNMHQKVFLFTRAGGAEHVVMVGSNNMTRNNAVNQWSDIYTVVGDPALFWTYAGVFDQMKLDVPQKTPFIQAEINGYGPQFYPRVETTQLDDPIYLALSQITCLGAAEGYGDLVTLPDGTTQRVTRIRISHHAWNGDRGRYLAVKVAELKRAGCDVRVIAGVGIGGVVKNILARALIPMSTGTVKGVRTHQKLMTVNGVYAGNPAATVVWNGSHNWSDGALNRDDVVLRVNTPEAYAQYNANFEDIWANG